MNTYEVKIVDLSNIETFADLERAAFRAYTPIRICNGLNEARRFCGVPLRPYGGGFVGWKGNIQYNVCRIK